LRQMEEQKYGHLSHEEYVEALLEQDLEDEEEDDEPEGGDDA